MKTPDLLSIMNLLYKKVFHFEILQIFEMDDEKIEVLSHHYVAFLFQPSKICVKS
jgi:hypothetical protein